MGSARVGANKDYWPSFPSRLLGASLNVFSGGVYCFIYK